MDTVRITGGGTPVYFTWNAPGQVPVLFTTATGFSDPAVKDGVFASVQALLRGTSGAQTASIDFFVTNDPHAAGADNVITGERNNFPITTTSGSATIKSLDGIFRADMDG